MECQLDIIAFVGSFLKANSYLMIENRRAILLDPCWCSEIENLVSEKADAVDYIFLTHEHYDHTSGAAAARNRYKCPVVASESCKKIIETNNRKGLTHFEAFCRLQPPNSRPKEAVNLEYSCPVDMSFLREMTISWQGHEIFFRATPGHSPGSCCILVDGKFLFSGDTLLPKKERPTIFPGGSIEQYEKTAVPYLLSLSPDVRVYPGHFMDFCLGGHPLMNKNSPTEFF